MVIGFEYIYIYIHIVGVNLKTVWFHNLQFSFGGVIFKMFFVLSQLTRFICLCWFCNVIMFELPRMAGLVCGLNK